MVNRITGTIRILGLNQRASVDTQSLFAALEAFTNLGDSFEEYRAFMAAHPTFWPVEFRAGDDVFGWGKDLDLHQLTIICRDYLRALWRGGGDVDGQSTLLKILLGLGLEGGGPELLGYKVHVSGVQGEHPPYLHTTPLMGAEWATGEFRYAPQNDFQRAVYALWRESWRARTCPECARLFIAAKPPQLYCSVPCSTAARQKRDRDNWHARGDSQRRARCKQSRRKKGVRPRSNRGTN
jgi:hypothetical protein